jgi:hypothetical protein
MEAFRTWLALINLRPSALTALNSDASIALRNLDM